MPSVASALLGGQRSHTAVDTHLDTAAKARGSAAWQRESRVRGPSDRRVTGRRGRWPYFGAPQRRLVFAGFGIWIGLALPWFISRPLGVSRHASPIAASWVLWAGLMVLAGAVARWRLLALVSALTGGGTAFVLGFWQMLVILQRCGFDVHLRCFPGPGLFVVQALAALGLFQGYRLLRGMRTG
jgi:hypothetical protein